MPIPDPKVPTSGQCPLCQAPLQVLGVLPVRVGGSSGSTNFWMGSLAELGERVVLIDTFRCTKCGRLEFYDFDFSLPHR